MRVGHKLIAETYDPIEIVRQAVEAERAGFDFVEISDHYHPWLSGSGHSGFAWSMLAAIAGKTTEIGLGTGVTCPTMRYHPAITAQAAATTALLSDGRFFLGLGSGENLNEHVIGKPWPSIDVRQSMLREAIEIIRLLWDGGRSYDGKHLQISDARVFDLPEELPTIAVAAGGKRSARIAAELGDALFATEPDAQLVATYADAGADGPRFAEVPLSWARDEDSAAASAYEKFRFGLTGWKVQAELPNPVNFDVATAFVTQEHILASFGCGADPDRHLEVVQEFVDAGFDQLILTNAGPDPDGFFDFFAHVLQPKIRALAPDGSTR